MNQAFTQSTEQIPFRRTDGAAERETRRGVMGEVDLRCLSYEVRKALQGRPDLFIPLSSGVWRSSSRVAR